jgi:hypothetical protein
MRTIELNGHTVPTQDLIDAWYRGRDRGEGYDLDYEDEDLAEDVIQEMTPYEGAEAAGMTKVQELDDRGEFVVTWDVYKWVVIADGYGPWAVDVDLDALGEDEEEDEDDAFNVDEEVAA